MFTFQYAFIFLTKDQNSLASKLDELSKAGVELLEQQNNTAKALKAALGKNPDAYKEEYWVLRVRRINQKIHDFARLARE